MIYAIEAEISIDELLAIDYVVGAQIMEVDGAVIVALKTKPIYLASERRRIKEEVALIARGDTQNEVFVTFDLDIYIKLKNLNQDDLKAKQALYEAVKARSGSG